MSDGASAVGTGGAAPQVVGDPVTQTHQTPAPKEGDATGKGCAKVPDIGLARSAAGARASADAVRQICNGGKPGFVHGTTSGGITRYFEEEGKTCAEGNFHVVCGAAPKAPQVASEKPGANQAAQGSAAKTEKPRDQKPEAGKPQAQRPVLTEADRRAMADLEAMMDEMR